MTRGLAIPEGELEFRFSRSGGPGGQNVNRRSTRVELVFDVASSPSLGPRQRDRIMRALASRIDAEGRLRVVAAEERSQAQNRARAVERFRALLAEALKARRPRRPTAPSRAARARRLEGKRRRAAVKRLRRAPAPEE